MRILGQDKQYLAILSTYPFTYASITSLILRILDTLWIPLLVFYIRQLTILPIRIGSMTTTESGIRMLFVDGTDTLLAFALLRKTSGDYGTCIIKNDAGMPFGVMTYRTDMLLLLVPTLNILHNGTWHTQTGELVLDTAVLAPHANTGILFIHCDLGLVHAIRLLDNICYDAGTISMYCDLPAILGISIMGTTTLPDKYKSAHLLLFCNIASDLRVVNGEQYITISGAADI